MPEGLRHLIDEGGPGKVFIGVDYPCRWSRAPVDHVIISIPGLSNHDRIGILGDTTRSAARIAPEE